LSLRFFFFLRHGTPQRLIFRYASHAAADATPRLMPRLRRLAITPASCCQMSPLQAAITTAALRLPPHAADVFAALVLALMLLMYATAAASALRALASRCCAIFDLPRSFHFDIFAAPPLRLMPMPAMPPDARATRAVRRRCG